jgi:hypothetical protein
MRAREKPVWPLAWRQETVRGFRLQRQCEWPWLKVWSLQAGCSHCCAVGWLRGCVLSGRVSEFRQGLLWEGEYIDQKATSVADDHAVACHYWGRSDKQDG